MTRHIEISREEAELVAELLSEGVTPENQHIAIPLLKMLCDEYKFSIGIRESLSPDQYNETFWRSGG